MGAGSSMSEVPISSYNLIIHLLKDWFIIDTSIGEINKKFYWIHG